MSRKEIIGKAMTKAEKAEVFLLAEAVRLHYMSLEGGGPSVTDEALFFLEWHYDCRKGLE